MKRANIYGFGEIGRFLTFSWKNARQKELEGWDDFVPGPQTPLELFFLGTIFR